MRGISQTMILRRRSPLHRKSCFLIAVRAKAAACSSVCRFSRGSDIHSRMIMRRAALSGLEAQLRRAEAITPELMSEAIAEACVRFGALGSAAKARVDRLIETSAWTDATLALVELELPQWQLRRLVYEDGEWLCSLSKQPRLPLGLDEAAEATHEILPLAILIAFLQARRAAMASATVATTVPQVRSAPSDAVCCDNFA
jgi:hypothetical protein